MILHFLHLLLLTLVLTVSVRAAAAPVRPNVLFIALDDMNDWTTLFDPSHPIRTPHLERLAARGVFFSNAHAASPACNPSRTAVLTGLRPTTTGVYGNDSDWRRALLPQTVTLPRYFMQHGYRVEGTGKIFHHHGPMFHDDESFHDFRKLSLYPDAPMPASKLNGLAKYGSPNTDWGVYPEDPADHVDVRTTDDAIARLKRLAADKTPFFLAVGIFRPHMPFFAPQAYFDQYPESDLVMPPRHASDMKDIPAGWLQVRDNKLWMWQGMLEAIADDERHYRQAVRAYQASSTFADAQIGRLLDALDQTGASANTIIVLWSDHGYHLGEKEHWEKFALWEKATRVPLIVVAPGSASSGARCERPVDLTAIFPTLTDLANLPPVAGLDGTSLQTVLANPSAERPVPAITTYHRGNHAVRDEHWRYIRYANGDEELYDHRQDPLEWNNLIGDPRYDPIVARLASWLPVKEADLVEPARAIPGR